MKTELIMKSDVLDIIFENRNKAYGAYYLRKFYSSRLLKSLAVMLAGVIVLSAFTFIPSLKKNTKAALVYADVYELKKIEKNKVEPEKPKEQVIAKKKDATVGFTTPKIVKAGEPVKPIVQITDTLRIADVTQQGDPGVTAAVGDDPSKAGDNGKDKGPVTEPAPDPSIPAFTAEIMPEFPGGMNGLRKFLERNLSNPRELEENEVISVKVRFVVGYDGKLKSFETIEDGGAEFNKEVIRVLKKMPEWTPGRSRGQNVSVYYTIPVKFVAASE